MHKIIEEIKGEKAGKEVHDEVRGQLYELVGELNATLAPMTDVTKLQAEFDELTQLV